jgi:hypothetical protein
MNIVFRRNRSWLNSALIGFRPLLELPLAMIFITLTMIVNVLILLAIMAAVVLQAFIAAPIAGLMGYVSTDD